MDLIQSTKPPAEDEMPYIILMVMQGYRFHSDAIILYFSIKYYWIILQNMMFFPQ